MRLAFLAMLFMALACAGAIAQKVTVTGKVTDSSGSPIPGASVTEKGTKNGVSANNSGSFSLQVNPGAKLIISATGFLDEEVSPAEASNVVLFINDKVLSEVVVTALQTRRNKNEVVYANQVVRNEELNAVTNRSALNALQGKVAGVKIGQSSGAPGASTRVVLRGETSLSGGNNALIVVDGVPLNNASSSGGGGTGPLGDRDNYVDFGNRANDINPDDIESMTVLKGPAATSLWGSRGSTGVILITTKKGKTGTKPRISVNSSLSTDRVYLVMEEQTKYGSGYKTCNGCGGGTDIFMGENFSWGAALDGKVIPWTGAPADADGNLIPLSNGKIEQLARPYSAVKDHLKSFFDYGTTNRNNISIDGGKEKFTYFLSYTNYNNKGIVPHTKYDKNNVLLNATAQFTDKLSSTFSFNYTKVDQRGATEGGYPFGYSSGTPAYAFALQTPINIPFDEMRDYNSPYQDFKGFYAQYSINPYYILDQQSVRNKVDNVIATTSLNYQIVKGLTLTGRASSNFSISSVTENNPQFAYARTLSWSDGELSDFNSPRTSFSNGSYKESSIKRNDLNFDVLLNYSKEIGENFKIGATGGFNSIEQRSRGVFGSTVGGLVVPGFYDLSNSKERASGINTTFHYRLFGTYLNANAGYKNMLFLEYSARNDWSSTLPAKNNTFFYQAGGLSFIPMNYFTSLKSDVFSFLKVRGNIGSAGKDAPAYRLYSTFNINPTVLDYGDDYQIALPFNGQPGANLSTLIGNANLKPELTITYEAGVDIGLFKDRLNIEYTYYNSNSKNQIVDVNLPISSGFSVVPLNIGRMTNKGHELAVRATVIKNKLIDWKLFATYSTNKNKVVSVANDYGLKEINIYSGLIHFAGHGSLNMVAAEGLPFGTFKATDFVHDNAGNLVVEGTGNPKQSSDQKYIGSYQPKFIASFGTDFNIKGFTIHGLLDARKGGLFYSGTKVSTEFNGTAATTTINDRQPYVIPNSVTANGEKNTKETAAYNYFKATPASAYLLDASYLKLRELTVSYSLPSKIISGTPISNVSLGLFAKNLFYWLPKENTFADPEVSGVGGNSDAQGVETSTTPSFRSFGVELKFTLK